MSKVNGVGTGGTTPPAVGESAALPAQPPAMKEGDAKGKGCITLDNVGLARSAAGGRARADALRQVCGGGKSDRVVGNVRGGIERYFVENGQTCAEGTFHVECGSPKPAQENKVQEKKVAHEGGAKPEAARDRKPKAQGPLLTQDEKAAMAGLEAMMDEMRMK